MKKNGTPNFLPAFYWSFSKMPTVIRLDQALPHLGFRENVSQQALLRLLNTAGGPELDLAGPATQIEDVDKFMQANFLRKPGTERQQAMIHPLESKKDAIVPELQILGFFEEVKPMHQQYDAMLLHGAAQKRVEDRIAHAKALTNNITFENIFLLGGQRELWPLHEPMAAQMVAERTGLSVTEVNKKFGEVLTPEILAKNDAHEIPKKRLEIIENFTREFPALVWPKEIDMMERISKTELHTSNIIPINAPKKPDGRRPDTNDTISAWKDTFRAQGSGPSSPKILAVSTQPHCRYQSNVLRKALEGERFRIETVAPAAVGKVSLAESLDALARTVHVGKELVREGKHETHIASVIDRPRSLASDSNPFFSRGR